MDRFFGWYVDGVALSALFLLHPIGWVLGLTAATCVGLAISRGQRLTKRGWLLLLWPLVTSSSAIVIGIEFRHDGDFVTPAPRGPSVALDVLTCVHLGGCLLVLWLAKGFRLIAVSALCIGTLIVGGCLFLATMSVTDLWL